MSGGNGNTYGGVLLSLVWVRANIPIQMHDLSVAWAKYLLGELVLRDRYPNVSYEEMSPYCLEVTGRLDGLWEALNSSRGIYVSRIFI